MKPFFYVANCLDPMHMGEKLDEDEEEEAEN